MGAGDRILKIIDHLKISKNKFSTKYLGLSASTKIDHIIKGRNELTPEFAKEICYAVPEINYDWLLKGKGDMFKENPTHKPENLENLDINDLVFLVLQHEDDMLKHPLFKKMIERHSLIKLNEKLPEIIDKIYRIKS